MRRMKTYKPRRSSKELKLHRQELKDFWHKINSTVGDYLVLLEEGSEGQPQEALERAKSEFHKSGPEMQRLANLIGNRTPKVVHDYLSSVENILLTHTGFLDRAKVTNHFEKNQRLERAL